MRLIESGEDSVGVEMGTVGLSLLVLIFVAGLFTLIGLAAQGLVIVARLVAGS